MTNAHTTQRGLVFASAFVISIITRPALTKISAEEDARLDDPELTPIGSKRAANADSSIPEWIGGLTEPPAGYKRGERLVDPFANDKPLFTITAYNYEEYKYKLSPGQIALLKRYPDTFSMQVYPTRRSTAWPQEIYKEIKEGAAVTELLEGGSGLKNYLASTPFPVQQNG